MLHVGPLSVLYALLIDPGCCPRAHFELDGQFESDHPARKGMQPTKGRIAHVNRPKIRFACLRVKGRTAA